jgi:hypothetical protein
MASTTERNEEEENPSSIGGLPALQLKEVAGTEEFMDDVVEEGDGSKYTERLKRVKRASIKLNVHIHDRKFVLNVGKGKQDLKWLAMVAAQRYVTLSKPNGRMRQREQRRRARVGTKAFQPINITTPRLSPRADPLWPHNFPHPKTRIRDLLRSGDRVEIKLDTTGNMDHMVTGFQNYAFHNSVNKQNRRRPGEILLKKAQIEKIKKREERRLQIARSLFGEEIDLETKETMALFSSEWENIKMPSYAKSKQDIVQLEQIIRENYVAICTAFKFYGGLGDIAKAEQSMNMFNKDHNKSQQMVDDAGEEDDDSDETISLPEFESFCAKTGVLDGYKVSHRDIIEVFRIVNQKMETHGEGGGKFKVEGDEQFDRSEFIEAIILLAHFKYDKEYDGKIVTQLHNLMVQQIVPHVERLKPSEFRLHMAEGKVCNLLLDSITLFKDVFQLYTDKKTNNEMNQRTFKKFCIHVGFLEGGQQLTKQDAEKVFIESQNERFPADMQVSFMQEMVLVEFMEGACRMANRYWPDTVGKLDVKVDMLIDLLRSLLQQINEDIMAGNEVNLI